MTFTNNIEFQERFFSEEKDEHDPKGNLERPIGLFLSFSL